MTKKKTKETVYQDIVTKDFVNNHSSSGCMGITQLYKKVTFNNGETTEVTGLDSHVLTKAIKKQEVLLKEGDLTSLENMLLSQSHTLNAIFTKMVTNMGSAKYLANLETYGRIALKAQNQTRQTASTLAEIKGIKKTTFVHQLNNAHNQQINNNRAGENLNNSANEKVINDVDGESTAERAGENQLNPKTWLYPKTLKGKKRSAMNATKHGMRSAKWRELEKQIAMLARQEREARKLVNGG